MRARSRSRLPAIHSKRHGFTRQTVEHEHMDEGPDPKAAADLALTARVAAVLETHYSGHPWRVMVDHKQGVVLISLPLVMPKNRHYVLHIEALKTDPALRAVMRAGGELLERYNVPRSGFSLTPFLEARAQGPYGATKPRLIMPG